VQICGLIRAPSDMHDAVVRISIADVTEGLAEARPVYSRFKQWQAPDSPAFRYQADLGRIPSADMSICDWMTVAELRADWLTFPQRGKRNLHFSASILSGQTGQELACGTCWVAYENSEYGYIDLQENVEQVKTLAVALAFAVSAADNKLHDCEIELIKDWTRSNVDSAGASAEAKGELERALDKTVEFFREGNEVDVRGICSRIVELVPVAVSYDILDLCLRVVRVKGMATAEEICLLKDLANWLEVDVDRFRGMMERVLPVSMHQVKDLDFVLGVNPDMSKSEALQRLNDEYRKWNSRVTNSDPEIRKQADSMLDLLARTRAECVA
ncbi:MAG: tellurite resistance TerB family protein, partial [Planctomycetota bacterium]